jgi:hypothetical protein
MTSMNVQGRIRACSELTTIYLPNPLPLPSISLYCLSSLFNMAPAVKEVGSLTNNKVDYVICYRYATAG